MTPERDAFGNPIGETGAPQWTPTPTPTHNVAPAAPPSATRPVVSMTGHVAPSGMAPAPPTAPEATRALGWAIAGIFFPLFAPIAWLRGSQAMHTIDQSMGRLGGRGTASTARLLGMVMTILFVAFLVLGIIAAASHHK